MTRTLGLLLSVFTLTTAAVNPAQTLAPDEARLTRVPAMDGDQLVFA